MKRYLSWVYTFSKSSASERGRMKDELLAGIRNFVAGKTNKGDDLYKLLKSGDAEFVGFIPEISYFRDHGRGKDLEAIYVHPFGGPTLLYKMKHAPALIIANPTLRFNDSFLRDAKLNLKSIDGNIVGITD